MQGSLLTDFDEIGLFDAFLHEMNKFGKFGEKKYRCARQTEIND